MKRLIVIFGVCIILLMTLGIVFASNTEDFIKKDLEKIGKNVKNVTELDNGFYEIDVGEEKPIFAITYTGKISQESSKKKNSKTFLNFGFAGEMNESGFLKNSGVAEGLEKGYVMMNKGSITGISTNLEILDLIDSGKIEIIIYKNGEQVGFRNTLSAVSSGIKKDYDIQSENIVVFEPGDVISLYAKASNGVVWKDIITMVEITFNQ